MMVFYPQADILDTMQPLSLMRLATAMVSIALASPVLWATEDANPYGTIVDRNPFGLKPPPPPPPPPETTAPPVPMAKVTLTGLISMFGEPRALFEIVEDPAKGGGTPKKPILREGERAGIVEVLAIDVLKNSVRIRNSGVETNMTFEVVKSGPAPGGPGIPGAPPTYTPPTFTPPPLSAAQPTVISPHNASAGGGVTLVGGGSTASPNTPLSAIGTSTAGGTPNIPARPLRTETASAEGLPPMTRDQHALFIEAQRLKGGPPLPPTHLTPLIQGAEQEAAAQQTPSPFPQFPPAPRGRPVIPGR
jgi:hypothetical protein